jgi:hypothetical protein
MMICEDSIVVVLWLNRKIQGLVQKKKIQDNILIKIIKGLRKKVNGIFFSLTTTIMIFDF